MTAYIGRRILLIVPMLIGLTILVFLLLQIAPGNAATYLVPVNAADPDQEAKIIASLGLDRPVWVQYGHWFANMLHGDFGVAFTYNQPALTVIAQRLWPTLQLQIAAIALSLIIAVPVGIISAVRRYRPLDHILTTGSLFGLSMPNFWFALLLILLLSTKFHWLPTFGDGGDGSVFSRIPYFVMPLLVLGLATVPWYARFMRANMIDTLRTDYVRAARARGVPERRIVVRHAFKPAVLPVITIVGLSLPRLVGGSVVVETIFAWPGLGRLAYDSIQRKDYPVVMALVLLTGAFVMIINLLTDVLYTVVDPRISL